MAQFPALPLFTDAYLADTRHLSAEQHGAYLLLLMEAWRRPSCSLPDDDEMLARLACMSVERWAFNRAMVMAFWTFDGRRREWTQGRLTDERNYVRVKSRSQRDKAAKRWNKTRKGDAAAMPEGMPDECPLPTPTVIDANASITSSDPSASDPKRTPRKAKNGYTPAYEEFWKSYPSTEGMSKIDGFKAWQRLTPDQQSQASASLPAYSALLKREEGRKVKHVQGYLNGQMFETMGGGAITELETPALWIKRLGHARARREWFPAKWGPAPGADGCRVPADLLRPGDGAGWQLARAA